MKNNKVYFKIGVFVLLCGAVLAAGLLYISADTIRGDVILVETYIDESVQGLAIGSPVVYRGVAIGHVKDITFIPHAYVKDLEPEQSQQFTRYVMVIMALKPKAFPGLHDGANNFESVIRSHVQNGMRFKLAYQGITGLAFMEADYIDPDREVPLSVPWVPESVYVPSATSLIRSFTHAIQDIFERIENMKIEEALANMEMTLGTMDQAIKDAKIAEVRESFIALTNEIRQSNEKLQPVLEKAQRVPDDFASAVTQFNSMMSRVESLLDTNEPDLQLLLADLKMLAQNFKYLSESLKQDPAQILLSSPPKRSEIVE
ncbi:MAG: MlaD family protein [Planctomycetota bacterium]|jgi:ABC-type transporter Mla subunit MlaD